MFKIFFKETVLLLILVLTSKSIFAETIVDTVFVDPTLDGTIYYHWEDHTYSGTLVSPTLEVGEYGWMVEDTMRSYLSFNLPEPREGLQLISVSCFIYQIRSIGNDERDTFPIWDTNPPPEEPGGIVDHVVYGDTLYIEDWTAGDPGDEQTLQSNVAIFTQGNPTNGWKNFEVTECIRDDYENFRSKSQFRLRFEIENDFDYSDDLMRFKSGDTITDFRPHIVITWSDEVTILNNHENIPNFVKTYPNPFKKSITVTTTSKNNRLDIEVFNLKGQKIISKQNLLSTGELNLNFENKPSGIYLLKVSDGTKSVTKKITYIK